MCHDEIIASLSISEQKKNLRKRAKSMLSNLFADKALAAEISKSVCDSFIKSELFRKAEIIFGFMAMPDEIDLTGIFEKSISDGKKVALPRMISGSNDMDFYFVDDFKQDFDSDNKFNIREPSGDGEKIQIESIPADSAFLVPGLAFNLSGSRLGRGKGYYDKYLSKVNELNGRKMNLCGVCTINVITKNIPVEENDILMTHILNEYGLVECTERIYKV